MKLIPQYYIIETEISDGGIKELQAIERAARTCYKSEGVITQDGESAKRLVKLLIRRKHEAMLEHSILSVRFIISRAIANEIVRHRICSFAQESTRYCNYSSDKFKHEVTFIIPSKLRYKDEQKDSLYSMWISAMRAAEYSYMSLLMEGVEPEVARGVLPLDTKTELVVTANYREWRNILRLRTDSFAHPDIRSIMALLLSELKERIPIVFDDLGSDN